MDNLLRPRFDTEDEALRAEGMVYRHYKGGIYRVLNDCVQHTETKEYGVYYEHLWPHRHAFYFRPASLFYGTLEDGQPRFTRVYSFVVPP